MSAQTKARRKSAHSFGLAGLLKGVKCESPQNFCLKGVEYASSSKPPNRGQRHPKIDVLLGRVTGIKQNMKLSANQTGPAFDRQLVNV